MTDANAKGPAKAQLPGTAESNLVPASEVKPEDVGMLSLRYVNGQPVLVVSGGTHAPARLQLVNADGATVGIYQGLPPAETRRLVETLDTYIPEPVRLTDKPFLMPIEDSFTISGRST